jgi:hypothetical protein
MPQLDIGSLFTQIFWLNIIFIAYYLIIRVRILWKIRGIMMIRWLWIEESKKGAEYYGYRQKIAFVKKRLILKCLGEVINSKGESIWEAVESQIQGKEKITPKNEKEIVKLILGTDVYYKELESIIIQRIE